MLRILRHPATCGPVSPKGDVHHYWRLLDCVLQLVECGLLDLDIPEDTAALRRFLRWVNTWSPEETLWLRPLWQDSKAVLRPDLQQELIACLSAD